MSGLRDDIRIALRRLAARPGLSTAAVLALALGIGFAAANYSVAGALLFRPLPIPNLDRAVVIGMRADARPGDFFPATPADIAAWRASSKTLQSFTFERRYAATLSGRGEPLQLQGARVSASFFDVMAVQPALGRFFTSEEEEPGRARSIVLNYNLWERQFAADPSILGHAIRLGDDSYTVSGILPRGLNYPRGAEFLIPLALSPEARADSSSFSYRVSARLRDGATLQQAQSELSAFSQTAAQRFPATHTGVTARVVLLRERASGDHAPGYTRIMIAAVLFLLLIACLNVANLQLARVLSRSREMAIRAALGASRLRIARQVFVEGLLLSSLGALLGVLQAAWVLDFIRASMPPEVMRFLPGWNTVGLNGWVLFWTALTAVAAGILSSLAPALWLNRHALASSLHESGRSSTGGAARHRLRSSLVVFETALAAVLLIGAFLMVRSFQAIDSPAVALSPDRALTFHLILPESRYPGSDAAARFQAGLLSQLQSLPGVTAAAFVSNLPGSGSANSSFITVEGQPPVSGPAPLAQAQSVSASYFSTLGIPLAAGRFFTPSDGPEAAPVAVVSQSFARRFFPDQDPVGRRIHLGDQQWITIVGIASDVLHDYTDRVPQPLLYRPASQFTWNAFDAIVATSNPAALAPAVRAAVRAADPAQPVYLLRSYRKLLRDNTFGIAYVASSLAALGAVALFLSILGVYSVMAYAVGERTREFGVRLALGAPRARLLWMVLRSGLILALFSLALGLPATYAIVRLLKGFIYGVSPFDPAAFVLMPLALAAALTAASLLPAWRAARTDPITALRHE